MKTTLTLMAGIATGICIGLLIAPDSGSETRRKVGETIGDWVQQMKNMLSSESEPEISDIKKPKSQAQTPQPQSF